MPKNIEEPKVQRRLVGEGSVSVVTPEGEKIESTEQFMKSAGVGPMEEVEFGLGVTLNQGDYNSLRIDIHRRSVCARNEVDSTFDELCNWAELRLKQAIQEHKRVPEPKSPRF